MNREDNTNMHGWRVAVVGAGLAGLACAQQLQHAGCRVTVYEKSRGPGGRLSTRRGEDWQCDHGAQYFTARTALFCAELARWQAAGVAGVWQPRLAVIDGRSIQPVQDEGAVTRYVGMPRMSAPAGWLAAALDVRSCHTVIHMHHEGGWRLTTREHGLHADSFDALVLAMPPAQAATLLEPLLPLTAMQAAAVAMAPCWTLMVRYLAPFDPGYDAAFVNAGPLRWIACDSSKPGRRPGAGSAAGQVWVLQASPEWSATRLEHDAAAVTDALLAAFAALGAPPPVAVTAHRWRYASADAGSAARQAVWLPAVRVGLCGDWLGAGRVEDAWLSGRALAAQLLGSA